MMQSSIKLIILSTNKSCSACPNDGYPNYKTLDLLTKEEVKKILIDINAINVYEKEFGKLEEG